MALSSGSGIRKIGNRGRIGVLLFLAFADNQPLMPAPLKTKAKTARKQHRVAAVAKPASSIVE